jgi:transcription elongation factor Elf1
MSTCTQCVATGAVQCQGEQSTLLAYPALTKKNEEDVLICRYCGHAVLAHFNIGK